MKIKITLLTLTLLHILCAKAYYPYMSQVYCLGNPVNFVDPDGKDALKIVDNDNKTITIKAIYYVVAKDRYYRDNGQICCVPGYKDTDIADMNRFSDYLNGLNLTVNHGLYNGYSLKFDLSFEPTESSGTAEVESQAVMTDDGLRYGNTIYRGNEKTERKEYKFGISHNPDGTVSVNAGVTSKKEIS